MTFRYVPQFWHFFNALHFLHKSCLALLLQNVKLSLLLAHVGMRNNLWQGILTLSNKTRQAKPDDPTCQ